MSIFDQLRSGLAAGLGPHLLDAVLIKVTPGTRTPAALAAGTNPTEASYPAKGMLKSWAARQIDGTIVRADDAVVTLLGGTIAGDAIPEPGDKIAIAGDTWRIVGGAQGGTGVARIGVNADGLGAAYRCHVRRA